jgi:hypothetical protein
MSNNTPSVVSLRRAIEITEQIEKLEAELKAVLSGSVVAPAAPAPATAKPSKPAKKKRTMSPEARARIVAAQKTRWAKVRAEKAAAAAASPAKGKKGK